MVDATTTKKSRVVGDVFSIQGGGLKLDSVGQVTPYVDEMLGMDMCREVHFSGNTIGVEAAKELAKAFEKLTDLEVINLSDAFTGRLKSEIPQALAAMLNAVANHKYLRELNLSDNALGPAGAEPLVPFLEKSRSLAVLRLNNNGLGITGGKLIAGALMKSAELCKEEGVKSPFQVVVAGRNRLEDPASNALGKAFAALGTLREVRLPQNGIRPKGMVVFLREISKCKDLRILDLQDNTFTLEGSVALAEALVSWKDLQILNIADCLLKKRGGLHIATALANNHFAALEHINMTYNEVTADSVTMLATGIHCLPALAKLDLNGNIFEADCPATMRLTEALAKHDMVDVLGSLSDMEEEDEDEEDDEATDEESEESEESDNDSDKEDKDEWCDLLR